MTSPLGGRYVRCFDAPFLNPGGHRSLLFLPGVVEIPVELAVVFPFAAYQVPPPLLPTVEHVTLLNASNFESQ